MVRRRGLYLEGGSFSKIVRNFRLRLGSTGSLILRRRIEIEVRIGFFFRWNLFCEIVWKEVRKCALCLGCLERGMKL